MWMLFIVTIWLTKKYFFRQNNLVKPKNDDGVCVCVCGMGVGALCHTV